jgi:pantoate--beta-alanine ligase
MKIWTTVEQLKSERATWRAPDETVGFVPTMGALHAGHLSLIERAAKECSKVVVSIFVNPTQFNDPKDLTNYPQPRERDLALLNASPTTALFLPLASEIYRDQYRFEVREKTTAPVLCDLARPGHFNGVLTVVLKLLNIVQPEKAYFGEKDFQQLQLIRDMTEALFLPTQVVPCPTVREVDGLAMSSRNALLTPEQRELAPALYKIIRTAQGAPQASRQLTAAGFRVDYVEEHWQRRFAAAFLGNVRLIDNVAL